jgi:hypothetical protein
MQSRSFILKSGAQLQVTEGSAKLVFPLSHLLRRIRMGLPETASAEQITAGILASDEVLALLWPLWDTCLYEHVRVTPELFDDPKWGKQARGDFDELKSLVIEANTSDFFLKNSSRSTTVLPPTSESQKSQ